MLMLAWKLEEEGGKVGGGGEVRWTGRGSVELLTGAKDGMLQYHNDCTCAW